MPPAKFCPMPYAVRLTLGGAAGARLAQRLGTSISGETILR